jgi:hypothetical protein
VAALQDTREQSEVLKERSSRQYIALGRDFLERGIRNNPDKYKLYESLGNLAQRKEQDHAAAADAYAKAAAFPDAPPYLERFAAYELAQVPGKEQEAYERLLSLYQNDDGNHTPALLKYIREMQEKLHIPADQQVIPRAASHAIFTPGIPASH